MYYNDKSKEIYIKNCMWYYFYNIFKIEVLDLDKILIDEKSYENILVYNSFYKSLIGSKPLHIRFNKLNRFIRVYDGTRYWILLGS